MVFIVRKNPILFDGSELKAVEIGSSGYEGFIKVLEAFVRGVCVMIIYPETQGGLFGPYSLKQLFFFS